MTATQPNFRQQTEPSAGKPPPEPEAKPEQAPQIKRKFEFDKVKIPTDLTSEKTLATIAAIGAGVGLCLVLAANIKPYSNAANALILKVSEGGVKNSLLGLIIGSSFFAAIQSLEVRPHFLEGSLPRQSAARFLSNFAYGLDLALGLSFFPPLKVSINEFAVAPTFSNINLFHVVILVVTLFGCESYVRMLKNLR
ncbi:MAG: hypothetical protein J7647_27540 [Cyanobacteria bacterium SBLK]|nr:hypothetical protein [Cyanobacteria bacterium SBLK]